MEDTRIENVFDDEQQYVGEVYAKALIGAATAAGKLDLVCDQLSSVVSDILDRQPKFEAALSSPNISQEDRAKLLDKVFGGKLEVTLLTFFKVLCRRGRLGFLRSIERAASRMRDDAMGRKRITVTTATAMNEKEQSALLQQLKGMFKTEVSLTAQVDPSVLGGIVIRDGDTVYDGSVEGKLQQLKKATMGRAEQTIRERIGQLAN
jgi:F-type H+-transporting ATPase subunit delta